ncbi:hypothetical protein [Lactobacillus taiwanensis]|uniref:Uncharacterized protein n=1 Tax=Lactobacillus taiwanensis TaxID=508451 RepID=A0A256L9S3_9LACO|nr:hypothetical protein [Lactobacillus taiwanensis]OYR87159.1 hypothetical protein CBF53_09220 [Lactobacillus taiwanensis]OYR90030.1 hypothetical protein CBF70_10280 [Lactobacillus taiwanensis]OYR92440.1 hypothetical protein CBF59_03855 [Lactobacillus taiwanensis]OYR95338.1 hypothetical protein CBF58_07380 [Lactobacillus taiwanensis]
MEIINKSKEKQEEQWQLGDVLEDKEEHKALIVKNNNGSYCLMDISPESDMEGRYSTKAGDIYDWPYSSLDELHSINSGGWHKVNAKLVIE